MTTYKIKLSNLNCDACVKVSQSKIEKIAGVEKVSLERNGSEAGGQLESTHEISLEDVKKALNGLPYQVDILQPN